MRATRERNEQTGAVRCVLFLFFGSHRHHYRVALGGAWWGLPLTLYDDDDSANTVHTHSDIHTQRHTHKHGSHTLARGSCDGGVLSWTLPRILTSPPSSPFFSFFVRTGGPFSFFFIVCLLCACFCVSLSALPRRLSRKEKREGRRGRGRGSEPATIALSSFGSPSPPLKKPIRGNTQNFLNNHSSHEPKHSCKLGHSLLSCSCCGNERRRGEAGGRTEREREHAPLSV